MPEPARKTRAAGPGQCRLAENQRWPAPAARSGAQRGRPGSTRAAMAAARASVPVIAGCGRVRSAWMPPNECAISRSASAAPARSDGVTGRPRPAGDHRGQLGGALPVVPRAGPRRQPEQVEERDRDQVRRRPAAPQFPQQVEEPGVVLAVPADHAGSRSSPSAPDSSAAANPAVAGASSRPNAARACPAEQRYPVHGRLPAWQGPRGTAVPAAVPRRPPAHGARTSRAGRRRARRRPPGRGRLGGPLAGVAGAWPPTRGHQTSAAVSRASARYSGRSSASSQPSLTAVSAAASRRARYWSRSP